MLSSCRGLVLWNARLYRSTAQKHITPIEYRSLSRSYRPLRPCKPDYGAVAVRVEHRRGLVRLVTNLNVDVHRPLGRVPQRVIHG